MLLCLLGTCSAHPVFTVTLWLCLTPPQVPLVSPSCGTACPQCVTLTPSRSRSCSPFLWNAVKTPCDCLGPHVSLGPRFAVSYIFIDPVRLGGALGCHLLQMLPLLPQGRSQVSTASLCFGEDAVQPCCLLPSSSSGPCRFNTPELELFQPGHSKSADKLFFFFFSDLLFAFQVYICRYYVFFCLTFCQFNVLVRYKIFCFVNKSSTSTEIFQCQKQSPAQLQPLSWCDFLL